MRKKHKKKSSQRKGELARTTTAKEMPRKWSGHKYLISFLVSLAGLLGSLLTIYEFRPKFSAAAISPDHADPFSARFAISNDGYLSVYDVDVVCWAAMYWIGGQELAIRPQTALDKADICAHTAELAAGEKITVPCIPQIEFAYREEGPDQSVSLVLQNRGAETPQGMKRIPAYAADIVLYLHYRVRGFPSRLETKLRFKSERLENGTIQWVQQPVIESPIWHDEEHTN